jgi:hypothetical protein
MLGQPPPAVRPSAARLLPRPQSPLNPHRPRQPGSPPESPPLLLCHSERSEEPGFRWESARSHAPRSRPEGQPRPIPPEAPATTTPTPAPKPAASPPSLYPSPLHAPSYSPLSCFLPFSNPLPALCHPERSCRPQSERHNRRACPELAEGIPAHQPRKEFPQPTPPLSLCPLHSRPAHSMPSTQTLKVVPRDLRMRVVLTQHPLAYLQRPRIARPSSH